MLIGARDPQSMTGAQRQAHDAIAPGPRKDGPLPVLATAAAFGSGHEWDYPST